MPRRPWTEKELATLRGLYPDTPTWQVARQMGRSLRAVYGKACQLHLCKSVAYLAGPFAGRIRPDNNIGGKARFRAGNVPHNKGCKGWDSGGRSAATRFKPGNRPKQWVPVGSTRISKDGIMERKVTDLGRGPRDWKPEHVIIWEQHNGPVPEQHIVVFLNGDRRDLRPENLEAITRAENMRRNSVHNLPAPLVEVIRWRGVLNRRIRQKEGGQK